MVSGQLLEVSKVQMEQTELMEEMEMTQRVSQLHPQWLAQLVLKVNVVKKEIVEKKVTKVHLEKKGMHINILY